MTKPLKEVDGNEVKENQLDGALGQSRKAGKAETAGEASTQERELPDGVGADCIRPGACNAPLESEREIVQVGASHSGEADKMAQVGK